MDERALTPIAWRDGVLIAPQHLQGQDLFHQASLAGRLAALSPFAWGVSRLRLDESALRQGQVRVLEVEAVFADGAQVRAHAGERGAPPPRAIAEAMAASDRSLEVFLALPELREGADNFADDGRYRPVIRREVADLCGGRSRVDLEVGEANLSVLLGDEARRAGVITLKIGELVRGADGACAWSTTYVPPCLAIGVAPGLGAELRAILALAIARRRALVELRREHDPGRAEFLGRDVTHYLLLDALGGAIPALRHLVEEPRTPPLAAYLALAAFAGKLTSFATEVDPAGLPSFAFLDLRASFAGLFAAIREMLGIAIEAGFVRVPLALRQEDGVWLGRLSDEALACRAHVLAVESTLPAGDVAGGLPRLSKVASWGRITTHVKQATPGVRIEHLARAPDEVPQRPGHLYFALRTDDPDWEQVVRERTLAIYFPEPYDPRRLRIELFGVRARAPEGAG